MKEFTMAEKLDKFTTAYIEAALWSSTDETTPEGGEPFDKNYSQSDIAPEALQAMIADCERFQRENEQWITEDHLVMQKRHGCDEQAGHDFWLTRNGHGAGFWDGDWSNEAGKALTAASKAFGECNIYLGDTEKDEDGDDIRRIYLFPMPKET
jgi:hypothetical protein